MEIKNDIIRDVYRKHEAAAAKYKNGHEVLFYVRGCSDEELEWRKNIALCFINAAKSGIECCNNPEHVKECKEHLASGYELLELIDDEIMLRSYYGRK